MTSCILYCCGCVRIELQWAQYIHNKIIIRRTEQQFTHHTQSEREKAGRRETYREKWMYWLDTSWRKKCQYNRWSEISIGAWRLRIELFGFLCLFCIWYFPHKRAYVRRMLLLALDRIVAALPWFSTMNYWETIRILLPANELAVCDNSVFCAKVSW